MNLEGPSLVPLQHASLCLDCDLISPARTHCLACGSQALLSIARALNRPVYGGLRHDHDLEIVSLQRRTGNFLHST